ncbi:DMT family transporter [Seohaeicola saemankumensis]|nr:DMT family transporter [Seohaeicola saemankumensis]MCA0871587.1 DMT family transporter [Seohaeicola saemankumensis]
MRLLLPTFVTMVAFAANSVLNRYAVDAGYADPGSFAAIRVLSGAIVLIALVRAQGRRIPPLMAVQRLIGAGTLALYMIGFSLAYLTLDAGLGALILFGVVQITMFAAAYATGVPPTPRRTLGAAIAFGGLIVVLGPSGGGGGGLTGAVAMAAAGIGWGFYTLAGRKEADPLAATAANFLLALPPVLAALFLFGNVSTLAPAGVVLAVLSGAVTSGLGYALWYSLLPRLEPSFAAVIQLSVPVIAVVGGVVLLGETVGLRFALGAVLVLGGIGFALTTGRRT